MLGYVLWGQEIVWSDLGIVGLLVLLEGVLSIDNALVLGLLAKRLPKDQRAKALTYGLVGAFAFRFLAIAVATFLLKWRWVKLLGGGYLAYIAIRHLFFESQEAEEQQLVLSPEGKPSLVRAMTGEELTTEEEEAEIEERMPWTSADDSRVRPNKPLAKFWPTVLVIELTDIAFAVDSILAALGVVGSAPAGHAKEALHPKLWVIVTGGLLGVILMRFAAVIFIRLLEKFPRFETAAYLLVAVIGVKLLVDWGFNTELEPHRVNFHDWSHPEFWAFWLAMVGCFMTGFIPTKHKSRAVKAVDLP
jgi:YkoY family integral membrane protein